MPLLVITSDLTLGVLFNSWFRISLPLAGTSALPAPLPGRVTSGCSVLRSPWWLPSLFKPQYWAHPAGSPGVRLGLFTSLYGSSLVSPGLRSFFLPVHRPFYWTVGFSGLRRIR